MVLEKLGSSLRETLQKIAQSLFVDEKLVNELIKDIQRALLTSDVNVKLVFALTNKIKERIKSEETPSGITKKEHLINVVYEELSDFLGKEYSELDTTKKPTKIMLVGLFGSGKTTTAGKIAKYYQKRGFRVAVVETDTWRPAAFDQLKQLSEKIHVSFYGEKTEKDPVKIYAKYENELKNYDIIIVDTAGRDALSNELIIELNNLNDKIRPSERLLVISGDIGQAAQMQAETFHKNCSITGVIITKLEGTAKGGGALTACSVTGAKVKFIGVGEKIDDLETFDPKRFVGRLLGMGDLESLLEKAKEAFIEKDSEELGKKFLKGDFNLIDLYEQMSAMKKMGPLNKIVELIPGFSQLKLPKEALETQEGKLEAWKDIMNSCTKEELEDPDIIDMARLERISKGSGRSISDARELLKQYKQSKKLVKMFKPGRNNQKDMQKIMKNFQGKLPIK